MSGLGDTFDPGVRWRGLMRAVLLLGGGGVAAVGVVAATASLVAGFGLGKPAALRVAVLFGGGSLLTSFLALFVRAVDTDFSRGVTGVGTLVGATGLALFWTTVPTGWTGELAALPPAAVGAYVVGLLAVFGAGVTADPDDDDPESKETRYQSDAFGSIETVVVSAEDEGEDAARTAAVGDGGETGSDLEFFDDEGS
ncbi:hypothetical protein [Halorussus sp. MSC15.2]|uniref:DUF7139 domain-containing protein n=1 Tax=Halorussus sp. MSC15.2 TaxID=2283638 RepID=UPI0013D24ED9|nr:hypothetical protein [Halorussus sp. MSC15.2]NEU57141.1 hypothetical protein [Halorussus sp. MSC15.2]